jgi:hypothetical protein
MAPQRQYGRLQVLDHRSAFSRYRRWNAQRLCRLGTRLHLVG